MKMIFAGTPAFTAPVLEKLLQSQHTVVGVLTQPDRPAGRGRIATPSPIKTLALHHTLPVYQPENLKDPAAIARLKSWSADILVVVGYGLIIPPSVLSLFPLGALNIHPSLLPHYRGATPVPAALLAGEIETGVTVIQLSPQMDAGPIWKQIRTPIAPEETAGELYDRLFRNGAELLLQTLDVIKDKKGQPTPQDEAQASYCSKWDKESGRINWNNTALQLVNQIRACNPWPVAFISYRHQPLRIWQARHSELTHPAAPGTLIKLQKDELVIAAKKNGISLLTVQLPGKKPVSIKDFINSQKAFLQEGFVFD